MLPQIIFMYGPAGSGKGTQTALLRDTYPEYDTVDIGPELKRFVATNLNSSDIALKERATRMNSVINVGLAVGIEDWQYVVGENIKKAIGEGKKLVLDGAIRSLPQASFLGRLVRDNDINAAVFHIHITEPEALRRIKNRWYVPDSPVIYSSYQEADRACPDDVLPIQRADDTDEEVVIKRYQAQYEYIWAPILSVFQQTNKQPIYVINGEQSVENVARDIHGYLE